MPQVLLKRARFVFFYLRWARLVVAAAAEMKATRCTKFQFSLFCLPLRKYKQRVFLNKTKLVCYCYVTDLS